MNAKEAIEELEISMNGDYISSKEAIDVAIEALLKLPVLEAIISLVSGDMPVSCASMDVIKERQRQVSEEGFSNQHDDQYTNGELAKAAAVYALPADVRTDPVVYRDIDQRVTVVDVLRIKLWPWSKEWWKPSPDNRRRELIKAAALIVAEIERLDRKCEAKK